MNIRPLTFAPIALAFAAAGLCLAPARQAAASEVVIDYPWHAPLAKRQAPAGVVVIANPLDVSLDSRRDGAWSEAEGVKRWDLTIRVPDASSVAVVLGFMAVDGAVLEVAGEMLLKSEPRFVSRHSRAETIQLSMTAPSSGGDPHVAISGLRVSDPSPRPKATPYGQWVNYACYRTPQNAPNGRASVLFEAEGLAACSATLINNRMGPEGAAKPMLLTAEHCQGDNDAETLAKNLILHWRFEDACGAAESSLWYDSKFQQRVVGKHLAEWQRDNPDGNNHRGDLWLIELDRWPRPDANAWLSGWDARDRSPDAGTLYGIHYAGLRSKQFISSPEWTYLDRRVDFPDEVFYSQILLRIDGEEAIGSSGGGASGSGLYNPSNRLIGVLSGGGTRDSDYRLIGSVWTASGLGGYLVPNPQDASARVLNGQAAPVPPVPALTLSADRGSMMLGDSVTLSWSASNVDVCAASGSWSGSRALNGSQAVTPLAPGQKTYVLTCDGPNGSITKSATVTVSEPAATPTPTPSPTPTPTAAPGGGGGGGSAGWLLLLPLGLAGMLRWRRAG